MRDRLLRNTIRERFIVTMKTGASFDGLLDEWDKNHLVLIDAGTQTQTHTGWERVAVPGQVFLPRDGVDYMQRLPR